MKVGPRQAGSNGGREERPELETAQQDKVMLKPLSCPSLSLQCLPVSLLPAEGDLGC